MRRVPRCLWFVVLVFGLALTSCGSTSPSSGEEKPVVTPTTIGEDIDVATSVSEPDTSLVAATSTPPVTTQAGVTTTTLSDTKTNQTVVPTTVAVTTTSVPAQTVLPEAETFEPDAPQGGFITYEPDT